MDEASQNSFYEDELPVSRGTTSEVRSHLKNKGLFTFKSTSQQSTEETTEPIRNEQQGKYVSDFTVPVCDDQKCQLAIQNDLDHTTSVSTPLPGEHRTVPSIEMCDERHPMADHLRDLKIISNEYQYFAACATLPSPPLIKSVYDSYKTTKDVKGKLEASQNELYLNWNGLSHFKWMNKVPAGWPAIGVKSFGTENSLTPHQSTLSLLTMVKQAHLLSEEQLEQIKESEFNEHFDQCYRPTLKRCNSSLEAFGSPIEKFSKTAQDVEIENISEDGKFFSQEETSDDCKDASCIYADQEVPVRDDEVINKSTGKATEVVGEQMSGNPVSIVSSFGDRPSSLNSASYNLNWLTSTGDNLHIVNAPFNEEPKKVPCTKSLCWEFFHKHHENFWGVNPPEKEGSSTYGAAKASSMNAEQGSGETHLTDQPGKNSELLEKQQIMIITNQKDPAHNEVQVTFSQSSVTDNIACKYPSLPEKAPNNTGLCLSLHAIDERALLTDPVNSVGCSLSRSRKDLQAEILLYQREQVDDWLHQCDVFPPNTATTQDLESFSSNIPVKNLVDRPPRHAECFDKVTLSDSKPHPLQAIHSEAPPENMKTEGPVNQGEKDITNFTGHRNGDMVNEIAPPDIKDDKKSNNSHQDKSDQFRTEIESKIIDLDGPELLQFAMILVQGALKKSQIVPSCNEQLKRHNKYMVTPAFPWRSALPYHGQPKPALGATNDEASNEPGNQVDDKGENADADSKERPSHLIRPLPKAICNRPLRLGLSRKHSNKRLHPYFKKHSNEKPS